MPNERPLFWNWTWNRGVWVVKRDEWWSSRAHLCGWMISFGFCLVVVSESATNLAFFFGWLWTGLFSVCFVRLFNFCLQHSVLPLKLWQGETRGGAGGGFKCAGNRSVIVIPPGDDCHHPSYDVNWSIDNKLRGGPNDKDIIGMSWKSLDMLRAVVQPTVVTRLSAVYDFLQPLGTAPEIGALDGRR